MAEALAEVTEAPRVMRSGAVAGWTAALVSAAAFGTSGAFAKPLLASGWSAGAVVSVRLGLAAVVLLIPGLLALRANVLAACEAPATLQRKDPTWYATVAFADSDLMAAIPNEHDPSALEELACVLDWACDHHVIAAAGQYGF